jgi:hypothetical protein
MNFRPELAAKVMSGDKTVTRRLVSKNPRSPWWEGGCSLKVGRDYAVCPGRGKNQIGRVVIVSTDLRPLNDIDAADVRAEGFALLVDFVRAFEKLNGDFDPDALVWRVRFLRVISGDSQ